MSTKTTPTTGTPPNANLTERAEQLQRELVAQRTRTNRSANLTLLLGVIVLAALGGYFYYGYTMIESVTQPETVVAAVQTIADDQIPAARKMFEDEVVRSSPVWAENLSKQAYDAMPTARQKLEEYILARIDETLDKGVQMTDEQFRTFLTNNRATIENGLKDLAANPQLAEATIGDLESALEKQLKGDVEMQSRELFATVKTFNEKLKKMRDGVNLDSREQLFRRLLMIGRRLLMNQSGSVTSAALSAITPDQPPLSAAKAAPVAPDAKEKEAEKEKDKDKDKAGPAS